MSICVPTSEKWESTECAKAWYSVVFVEAVAVVAVIAAAAAA